MPFTNSMKLVFTLERAFNRDTSVNCVTSVRTGRLYVIPPSICTMFLDMYEQSLAKLVGGVMATGPHSKPDAEVEPCSIGTFQHPNS